MRQVKEAGLIPEDQVRLCAIGDGAPWIWKWVEELFPSLSSYLHAVAEAQYGADAARASHWLEATLARLFCGEGTGVADHFGQPARGKLLALAREMIGLPDGPQLRNAPNPFNGQTVISWFLLSPGPVRLEIYNTLGQRVRTLVDEVQAPGRHRVYWDALGQRGAPVAAGVYLSRLQYPGGVRTQRLLFLK